MQGYVPFGGSVDIPPYLWSHISPKSYLGGHEWAFSSQTREIFKLCY